MCYIAAPPHMRRVVRLLVEERMQVKLLQVVWNFPETVKQPFNMYYFYWPLYEAMLRGWKAEVLTFQVNEQQRRDKNNGTDNAGDNHMHRIQVLSITLVIAFLANAEKRSEHRFYGGAK